MDSIVFYGAVSIGGIVGGWAFANIWRRLVPMSLHRSFWSTLVAVARDMLHADETRVFLGLYRRLAVSLFRYLGRNMAGMVLACVPVVFLALVFNPILFGPWDGKARVINIHPPRRRDHRVPRNGRAVPLEAPWNGEDGAPPW